MGNGPIFHIRYVYIRSFLRGKCRIIIDKTSALRVRIRVHRGPDVLATTFVRRRVRSQVVGRAGDFFLFFRRLINGGLILISLILRARVYSPRLKNERLAKENSSVFVGGLFLR